MKVLKTEIPDLMIVEPKVFGDARGFFLETWNSERYAKMGIAHSFVQDNVSLSAKGVLRGLHLQSPNSQGKLVYVLEGEVFDVAVDLRKGSPTFGKSYGLVLSSENKRQFFVPPGFAHGFCVTSETALFAYKCTSLYQQMKFVCSGMMRLWRSSGQTLSQSFQKKIKKVCFSKTSLWKDFYFTKVE